MVKKFTFSNLQGSCSRSKYFNDFDEMSVVKNQEGSNIRVITAH